MKMRNILLCLLFLSSCSKPPIKVGECYAETGFLANTILFSIRKVIKVDLEHSEVEYIYSFPNDAKFYGRWATSSHKSLVIDSFDAFRKLTPITCPW